MQPTLRCVVAVRGAVEFHVRAARIIDIESAERILEQAEHRDPGDADLLRNMLYLPAATVVVAEVERQVVGVGVLSIRPSARDGGFVGVIDEFAVAKASVAQGDDDRRRAMASSVLEHLVVSARNKGCTRVEVSDPLASVEPLLWQQAGFTTRGACLSRPV
jgi:N-acetylglutamate synthase-like GNAT family acetyltransferase